MSINYERDSNGNPFIRVHSFGSHLGLKFRGTGVTGTATQNTTTNINYELTEDVYIDGIRILLKNHVWGDTGVLQIIAADTTTVLDQFGVDWNFDDTTQLQGPILLPYQAKLTSGWFIRVIYNSIGVTNDVDVKINYHLHKVPE